MKTADIKNNFNFAKKPSTRIWHEKPSDNNPYIAENAYLFGYDFEQLVTRCNFPELLFLLFQGELPSPSQKKLLELLMKYLIAAGPRDSATRAAMTAGISKANPEHILPTALMAIGGEAGAAEVEKSFLFIRRYCREDPVSTANDCIKQWQQAHQRIAPGFGTVYGSLDRITNRFAQGLARKYTASAILSWTQQFVDELEPHNAGWLSTGLAAAVFNELGFGSRESIGLFQLMRAPGLVAHGMEQTHKPLSAMPLVEDQAYHYESEHNHGG